MSAHNDYLARKVEAGETLSPDEVTYVARVLRGAPTTETGTVIHEILEQRGLTQNAFAGMVGVSQSYLSRIQSGTVKMSPTTVKRFAAGGSLTPHEASRLHTAAAKDVGYEIDLTTTRIPKGK